MLDWIFSTEGFVPRTMCGPGWNAALIWTHRVADLVIFAAYALLFFALLNSARARGAPATSNSGIVIYALFIVSCGVTHLVDQLMFVYPMYNLGAIVKVVCALLSCAAVWWTFRHFLPRQHT